MGRTSFFDDLAARWDEITGPVNTANAVEWASTVPIPAADGPVTVLDVGCGTGISSAAWAERLAPNGRVVAFDNSLRMVQEGKRARPRGNLRWLCCDALSVPLPDDSVDLIAALHVWPHITDKVGALTEWGRLLKAGGELWIIHLKSKETINSIHRDAGGPVHKDLLPPVAELAEFVAEQGWNVLGTDDCEQRYFVRCRR